MAKGMGMSTNPSRSWLDHLIWFSLQNRFMVFLLTLFAVFWGLIVSPFEWKDLDIPRDPVPVDAIPDLGENQQIVFTQWPGRSPQDIEDQITYPLTTALLGVPGVETVRSQSFFGFSSIYVIFEEKIDFYWSRSRILEKLNSLGPGTLPTGIVPHLGPDATALGQVFWYTLEGRNERGEPTGGWDLDELRSIQDWYVRYALLGAGGVSEVASIGGYVREYQINVDPDALRVHQVTLEEVFRAIQMSNQDVGARNLEINQVEYFIRGVGFVKNLDDLRFAVVKTRENVPVYIKDVAHVGLGPAQRRGVLDKGGAEVVGGVVVARFGENPLAVIENIKAKIEEITPGLPEKTLADGSMSKLTVVPFYDRSGLIGETLQTLETALSHEILVTIIVILIMLMNGRSAALVSTLLPLAVLLTFIAMKYTHVDANIVALSGIAIAIGTMVDMGIVLVESMIAKWHQAGPEDDPKMVIFTACQEVSGAVLTAVATTVISFLPVFAMVAAEGKLFKPLAFTKTFALLASILVTLIVLPAMALVFLGHKQRAPWFAGISFSLMLVACIWLGFLFSWIPCGLLGLWGAYRFWKHRLPQWLQNWVPRLLHGLLALAVALLLTEDWLPLGPEYGLAFNFAFVLIVVASVLGFFLFFRWQYENLLTWAMGNRLLFLCLPAVVVFLGAMIWLGQGKVLGWLPKGIQQWQPVRSMATAFPGLGKEFMPPLDEGSFLFMPTTSPHAAINEAIDVLQKQDMAFDQIPEIETAVGKLGRVESSLDPAPISMIETIINYHPQYLVNAKGRRLLFEFDTSENDYFRNVQGEPLLAPDGEPYKVEGKFIRDANGALIPHENGQPFRLWRSALDPDLNPGRKRWAGIHSGDDIWDQIVAYGKLLGTTSAPRLQPIAGRLVMLQSGMRAPMGIKIKGPSLEAIESAGLALEKQLKKLPEVRSETVIADRIIGKPYLEIKLDRQAMARHGIMLEQAQNAIEMAIGGKRITTTVEGRERYAVRVRYQRERRDTLAKIEQILVAGSKGIQIPLSDISDLAYTQGPQVIKSEDTFLISYVIFDKKQGFAEVEVVDAARKFLKNQLTEGKLKLPEGVSYTFTGSYENQVRASQKLAYVLPLALGLIMAILFFQFRSLTTTFMIFSAILVAWSGGFLLIWLYGQSWFMDVTLGSLSLRDIFAVGPINLSVAVWVGFLALFGIASDDGVLIATYLDQSFREKNPKSVKEIREATLRAGLKRVRPALMTSATTVIALVPILTSTGRGSDIMKPMALPTFGGMLVVVMTIFVVPVLYSWVAEVKLKHQKQQPEPRLQ